MAMPPRKTGTVGERLPGAHPMSISARLVSTTTAWVLAGASLLQPGHAARLERQLVDRLHQALNNNDAAGLTALINQEGTMDPQQLMARLGRLEERFGPLTWQVSQGQPLPDGRALLELEVRGMGEVAGVLYQLEATPVSGNPDSRR